jgi:hypothetical protein
MERPGVSLDPITLMKQTIVREQNSEALKVKVELRICPYKCIQKQNCRISEDEEQWQEQ